MNLVNETYLKKRFSKLHTFRSFVTLMFDEIYVANRIEFSKADNCVLGLTADNKQAKTILVFMIKSIAGEYRDVVCMFPKDHITSEIIRNYF